MTSDVTTTTRRSILSGLLFGLVVGVPVGLGAGYGFVVGSRTRNADAWETMPVLVTAKELPAGHRIVAEDLTESEWLGTRIDGHANDALGEGQGWHDRRDDAAGGDLSERKQIRHEEVAAAVGHWVPSQREACCGSDAVDSAGVADAFAPSEGRDSTTVANAGCIIAGLSLSSWSLVALGPIVDHLLAQAGHRRFERNRTRPWRHPLWHARAELRLFATTVGLRR